MLVQLILDVWLLGRCFTIRYLVMDATGIMVEYNTHPYQIFIIQCLAASTVISVRDRFCAVSGHSFQSMISPQLTCMVCNAMRVVAVA